MSVPFRFVSCITLLSALAAAAAAQQPSPPPAGAAQSAPASAQSEAGEPRAATSAQAEAGEPRAATSAVPPTAAGTAATSKAAAEGAKSTAGGAVKPAGGPRTPRNASSASGSSQKPPPNDRIDLGLATVTGDREQPKVMYVVPWKKSDIGDLSGKPMNSLLDEALAPVDRDEFKREVVYYQAVQADASQNGASRPAAKGEK